jgi:tetratricopeptide (TPR) repeat protein
MRIQPTSLGTSTLLIALVLTVLCGGATASQEQAIAPNPDTPEAHLGKGYDALKQDRYDVAVTEFRAALRLDPSLVERAQFPLAVALFEMHKPDEARREFEAVVRVTGEHPNVLYYLGRLDLNERKFDSAIRNLSKASTKPPFPDTAYYLGFAYLKQGNLTAAEKWLNEAAQQTPNDARVPYQLGLVYRKQGRQEEAAKAFALSQKMHQQDDREGRLRMECGQKLDQGLREEAHAICEQLYDPDDAEKLTELGTIYGRHGDLQAALKPLQRAAELSPHSPQMQYNLALLYFQMSRFEDARVPLTGALKRWPDLFQLNALYGAVLLKLGDLVGGQQALRHAHELNAQDPATENLYYLSTLDVAAQSRAARKYAEALRYLQEASKLRPQEPEPHRRIAEIYRLTGRSAEAAAEQQQAERLARNVASPH